MYGRSQEPEAVPQETGKTIQAEAWLRNGYCSRWSLGSLCGFALKFETTLNHSKFSFPAGPVSMDR